MEPVAGAQLLLDAHEVAGRYVEVSGLRAFVREGGVGDAVLLVHGVPASSYLYRRVIDELAAIGLRGMSIDLPGFGLTDRPAEFDYSMVGLGRWLSAAVDALGLDRFHLVVHDAGGPIGFELALLAPERLRRNSRGACLDVGGGTIAPLLAVDEATFLAMAPFIRPDGSICTATGYDTDSEVFLIPSPGLAFRTGH